ncbi:uncharacterized protein LOC135267108 [Tribolium castaneum]|uniref:uncharacterized protein LOC135267108 n=1 Tax=Tribolium castaneum TaxID=7070 RepID=UPI0030FE8D32
MSQASDNVSQNVTPNTSKLTQKVPKIVSSPVKPRQGSVFLVNSENSKCALCNRDYLIYKCPTFLAKSPQSRYEIVKSKQWCLNCLGAKHLLRNCNSSSTCRDCHQRHHSLLHFVSSNTLSTQSKPATISENPIAPIDTSPKSLDSPTRINSLTNLIPSQSVLLSTAVVEVQDSLGQFQEVRILLDSASQANFITKNCAERLGLSRKTSTFIIKGLGGMNDKASKEVSCTLRSKNEPSIRFSINAILFDKICDDMPSVSFSTSGWTNLMNLTLADSQFNLSRGIDMLLGADIFPLILESGRLLGNSDVPTAMNTKFGWILMGQFRSNTHRKHSSSPHLHSFCATIESFDTIPLENIVKQFWEIEEPNLVDLSFPCCLKKTILFFPSIERRLIKNPLLYEDYKAFMNEYLDLGHMQLLTNGNSSDGYYIPHHCVIKADSPSTKLRVVFDASCPSSEGKSLNDSLFVGPKLQKDILTILSRFRVHPIVFTADIRQMYRQILILPEHRKFQKILWRNSPQEPVQEYQLNTVTYGVSSSPFLAIRTLGELASLEKTRFPLASEVLVNDVYIDDIITGCSSIAEAHNLRDELIDLLSTAGFELRKWSSNDPTVLNKIPLSHQLDQALAFNSESEFFVKVLGLQWNPRNDSFSYSIQPFNRPCSKRSLLSELARIFDPIGFLAPLTFYAKRLIQYLWTLKLSWDDSPPDDIISSWTQFCSELPQLATLQIPRKIIVEKVRLCTLHGFCDASESGYAAVVYLRSVSVTHAIEIRLICAKSKVTPLKKISIPRLELCAAVLLAKLIDYTLTTFKGVIEIEQVYAWSDSTIALSWIQSSPHLWKVFVSNRVALIQSLAPTATWHHVSSDDNPADCASRGLNPMHLLQHLLWWAGPTWLRNFDLVVGKSEIPDLENDSIMVEEQRKVVLVLQTEENCGTNFVGGYRELNRHMKSAAERERLRWHFNPPSAPHFGGIWEAGIKSVKTHLHRLIGEQILTFEELYTVLTQIESVLNSRLLCPVSADPNDLSVLTPGHFLTLEPLSAPPDSDLSSLKINRLTRWQLVQRLHQDFWSRWHQEYLHTLQQRILSGGARVTLKKLVLSSWFEKRIR